MAQLKAAHEQKLEEVRQKKLAQEEQQRQKYNPCSFKWCYLNKQVFVLICCRDIEELRLVAVEKRRLEQEQLLFQVLYDTHSCIF